jgi:hypothetical protein
VFENKGRRAFASENSPTNMATPTPSERFVAELCHRAFLRLWTHPSPKGKKDKELCDCLVVCGPHIIIVSVKEIQYRDTGNRTGWDRW